MAKNYISQAKEWSRDQQTAICIYAMKGNYQCHVCFKNVDGKVQERLKRATLCICRPRESLQQVSTGRAVVLYEKIRNSGKVCGTCAGYV